MSIDQQVAAQSLYPCSPRIVVYLTFSTLSASGSGSTAVLLDPACSLARRSICSAEPLHPGNEAELDTPKRHR